MNLDEFQITSASECLISVKPPTHLPRRFSMHGDLCQTGYKVYKMTFGPEVHRMEWNGMEWNGMGWNGIELMMESKGLLSAGGTRKVIK